MEILLSYAAFVYYTNKKKYKVQNHLDNSGYISFWYGEDKKQNHIFQIITNTVENDCGYIVINSKDVLKDLFNDLENDDDYDDFINNINLCERKYGPDKGKIILLHCSVPTSERKIIKTKIDSGEVIKCLHKNKP
jgi:hypothetical protein